MTEVAKLRKARPKFQDPSSKTQVLKPKAQDPTQPYSGIVNFEPSTINLHFYQFSIEE